MQWKKLVCFNPWEKNEQTKPLGLHKPTQGFFNTHLGLSIFYPAMGWNNPTFCECEQKWCVPWNTKNFGLRYARVNIMKNYSLFISSVVVRTVSFIRLIELWVKETQPGRIAFKYHHFTEIPLYKDAL